MAMPQLFVQAALLLCSTGHPAIAEKIVTHAVANDVDPAVALAVGLLESGYKPGNPMGVRGCYPKAKATHRRTDDRCIEIGVKSIRNRLLAVKSMKMSQDDLQNCSRTGNIPLCRALVRYNGSKHKYRYAKRGVAFVRKLYSLVGMPMPEV